MCEHVEPVGTSLAFRGFFQVAIFESKSRQLTFNPVRECLFDRFRLARGISHEQMLQEPSAHTVINTNSPLKLDVPMAMGIIEMARLNQIVVVTPFTLLGAMAPVSLAGGMVEQNAEALAGIAFTQLILQPNKAYDIVILQEATLWEGRVGIVTGPSGSRIEIPPIIMKPPVSWDFDGDGLHDAGELVMGTDRHNPDTDGDGLTDGREATAGTNLLVKDTDGDEIGRAHV